ncbi:hypothetical protein FRC03_002406 [Tulasnella sp. 419]|nr:hypothetical protein FRC03_002406 [Tulasnella sp. 419]
MDIFGTIGTSIDLAVKIKTAFDQVGQNRDDCACLSQDIFNSLTGIKECLVLQTLSPPKELRDSLTEFENELVHIFERQQRLIKRNPDGILDNSVTKLKELYNVGDIKNELALLRQKIQACQQRVQLSSTVRTETRVAALYEEMIAFREEQDASARQFQNEIRNLFEELVPGLNEKRIAALEEIEKLLPKESTIAENDNPSWQNPMTPKENYHQQPAPSIKSAKTSLKSFSSSVLEKAYLTKRIKEISNTLPQVKDQIFRQNTIRWFNQFRGLSTISSSSLTRHESIQEAQRILALLRSGKRIAYIDAAKDLLCLGHALRNLGMKEQGYVIDDWGLQICWDMASSSSPRTLLDLARFLHNLSASLCLSEYSEDARRFFEQAVKVRAELEKKRQTTYLARLASSLTQKCAELRMQGVIEACCEAGKEVINIYHYLEVVDQETYAAPLHAALENLSNDLKDVGMLADAVKCMEEAVEICRKLVWRDRKTYLHDLNRSLYQLSQYLDEIGRQEDAVRSAEEAVQIGPELVGRDSSEQETSKRQRSIAKSIRQLFETTSHPGILLAAARNIPLLLNIESLKIIFAKSDEGPLELMSRYLGYRSLQKVPAAPTNPHGASHPPVSSSSHLDGSAAYTRLVSLFRGSLTRYLSLSQAHRVTKQVDETIVYGRALFLALITSNGAPEAFKRLSEHLSDIASLAMMEDIDVELRLLLSCILNNSRFWFFPDHLDVSLNPIDASILPMYIMGISIVSLAEYASVRELWVHRLIHCLLNTSDPSPRLTGVAAKALVYMKKANRQVEKERMLVDLWDAYESGDKYVSYVLEALEMYPFCMEATPDCIEAYSALIRAFRITNKELGRADLRRPKLGSEIIPPLERILIEASGLIDHTPSEADMTISVSVPAHEAAQHISPHSTGPRALIEEILMVIEDGQRENHWSDGARPSWRVIWKTAEVVEPNSNSLRILLQLMNKMAEDFNQYRTLFHDYPAVAPVLTTALNSTDAQVRIHALLLICRNAQEWFEDRLISRSFMDSKLDEYLVCHLQFGDTPHHRVKLLVAELGSKLAWRIRFHRAFHGLALSSRRDSSSARLLELSLDVWYRFSILPKVPEMKAIMLQHNWYSPEMVSKVTDYVSHRVEAYQVCSEYEAEQMTRFGISESLHEYVRDVKSMVPRVAGVHGLLRAMRELQNYLVPQPKVAR